ncbi:unnamed protein product, partial [Protopolystoma xenopodis]
LFCFNTPGIFSSCSAGPVKPNSSAASSARTSGDLISQEHLMADKLIKEETITPCADSKLAWEHGNCGLSQLDTIKGGILCAGSGNLQRSIRRDQLKLLTRNRLAPLVRIVDEFASGRLVRKTLYAGKSLSANQNSHKIGTSLNSSSTQEKCRTPSCVPATVGHSRIHSSEEDSILLEINSGQQEEMDQEKAEIAPVFSQLEVLDISDNRV